METSWLYYSEVLLHTIIFIYFIIYSHHAIWCCSKTLGDSIWEQETTIWMHVHVKIKLNVALIYYGDLIFIMVTCFHLVHMEYFPAI